MIEHDSFLFLAAKDLSTAQAGRDRRARDAPRGLRRVPGERGRVPEGPPALVRSLAEVPVPHACAPLSSGQPPAAGAPAA